MSSRSEHDLLGEGHVPADVYWGIHTGRALENFPLGQAPVPLALIAAIAKVKKACCRANAELGFLSPARAHAIGQACDEIIAGALSDQFPLRALQGGAGTSTNMNVNEVVANRALELMGHPRGDYAAVHPLDHVNLHQSTNDVYPTAVRIAAIDGLRTLSEETARLQGALQGRETAFADIVTVGRTELTDAVPMTLGAQFSCFADAVARDRWRTFKCEERLRVVNIGGTAVGTGLAAPQSYIFLVIEKLREVTGYGLTRGENVMDQTANADSLAEAAGMLAAQAATLTKIANDLRLLHALGEIAVPPVQAGSSIMPGKVNPVILEAAVSAALRARTDAALVAETASMGTLQINEFMPLLAWSLLSAIDLLAATCRMLAPHVDKIEARRDVCERRAWASPALITAILPRIGYERAQEIVKEFAGAGCGKTFRDFLAGKLGAGLVDEVLSPQSLMALGYRETTAPPRAAREGSAPDPVEGH